MRTRIAVTLLVCCAIAGSGGACGPVQYVSQVTRRASAAVESAKAAGADKWAPYEYTMAVNYLHKAREEEGFADHQAAIRFGKKAEIYAKKAAKISVERADGSGPDTGGGEEDDSPLDPSDKPPTPEEP